MLALAHPLVGGLANGLALTPPMGWMSWERFRCITDCGADPDNCLSEKLFHEHIDVLAAAEWRDLGYEYVNLDDCWLDESRTAEGKLAGNATRFPSGIKSLADYAHSKGLKLGIYESMGTQTCGGLPGECKDEACTLPGYMTVDAQTFAEWGIDSLKMDGCHVHRTPKVLDPGYKYIGAQLNATGRRVLYSCSWPDYIRVGEPGTTPDAGRVNYTETAEHCNLWRMYNDIQDDWDSVTHIVDWVGDHQDLLVPAAGPGQWNDPDMLIIGNFALNEEQARAQFALWCVMAAPLLMGNDLRHLAPPMKAILQNKEVIAVDQDALGVQGRRLAHVKLSWGEGFYDTWSKPLAGGDLAVLLWNRNTAGTQQRMSVRWELLGLPAAQRMRVRDLYAHEDLGAFAGKFSTFVNIDGVAMLRFSKA